MRVEFDIFARKLRRCRVRAFAERRLNKPYTRSISSPHDAQILYMPRLMLQWGCCLLLLLGSDAAQAATRRYRAIWNDDPATTMTLAWEQVSGGGAKVFYDVRDHGSRVDAYAYFAKVARMEDYRGMRNQFARLKGLRPDTRYYVVIRDSEGVSRQMWFRTAPATPDKRLSIVAGGDSRNHRLGRQNANLLVAKLRPHCVLFGGDMTASDNPVQWQQWMDDWQLTIPPDGQLIPIIPARGNHEYSNWTIERLFDTPNTDIVYALTLGGSLLRAYTLNSLIPAGGKQSQWLQNDLKAHQHITWRMAQYHHPIRPHTTRKSDKPSQYKYWAPLFYQYGVQLVVECDAHLVKTTYPIRPSYGSGHDEGFVRDDVRGTVYVGEGCWGAPLRPNNDNKSWTRASGSFNQFKWIWVDRDKMEIRTVKTDNARNVAALSPERIFALPRHIDLWQPPTGAVVTIRRKPVNEPKVAPQRPTAPPLKARQAPSGYALEAFKMAFAEWDFNELSWQIRGCPEGVKAEVQRARAADPRQYETLVAFAVTADADTRFYTWRDKSIKELPDPVLYYMLKLSFPNGYVEFSDVVAFWMKPMSAFPHAPVEAGAVEVRLDVTQPVTVHLSVIDEAGHVVLHEVHERIEAGTHTERLDVSMLPTGRYLMQVRSAQRVLGYWAFERDGG